MKKYLALLLLFTLGSCEKLAIKEVNNDPVAIFELFWQDFDRYYSFFEQKNVDWDSVYAVYRPQAADVASSSQLRTLLANMSLLLRDGHTGLITSSGSVDYDFKAGFPTNSPNFARTSLTNFVVSSSAITYGTLDDLGYIRILSFSGEPQKFTVIHEVLDELRNQSGIVIDVRSNGGGNDAHAALIANRFADQRRRYNYARFRNGPEHDDFTQWAENFISPSGPFQYTKPVALLTNRGCFSSCEDFVMMMRTLPHVTLIGGQTGGGTGRPLHRELPNGWTFRLSSGMLAHPETQAVLIDSIGTLPDIEVHITPEDSAARRDTILERAILELGG